MGHLIPAGTGFRDHRDIEISKNVIELKGEKEERQEAEKEKGKKAKE